MGRLNRIVEIQHRTVTRDSFGSEIETFVELDTVWAEKVEVKPSEKFIETSARNGQHIPGEVSDSATQRPGRNHAFD